MNKLAISKHLIKAIIILLVISFSNVAIADGGNAAIYKGTLTGEWSGEIMGTYFSGTFFMNISADGTISGSYTIERVEAGTISGKINASGDFNAKGSADITEWSGKINISSGLLSGSGNWKCGNGGGTWNSK
ncbi:MAG: hypothetical protein A2031_09080 [Deltaproteobacteria bacterium RBG_19FT_COMBO_43_11]|nr:MAG: hypothetical protein A2031_09080 [Deltaproteobacteria bacterium RBG_19FT_COMBO_43_11]